MNTKNESQFADLLAIFATLIGLLIRLALPLTSSFPLNDGGLFFNMIRDLQNNGYALPEFTTYNNAGIPFTYPPFALYVTGLLADFTHIELLTILRILPAIVSAAGIPIFYLLAKVILPNKPAAALAAMFFALTPRVFDWMIMGGGITRSFGFLFALLTIHSTHRLFTSRAARFIIWTSIWAALTVLTHPEAIPQTALAAITLYFFLDRSRKGFVQALVVSAGVLLLTAPWWITILGTHGLVPFIAVSTSVTGDSKPVLARVFFLFQFIFTEESFLPLVAVLGLMGAFLQISRRRYFLPLWMALPYLIEPRGGTLYMMIPLTMLAALGLTEIILPALQFKQHGAADVRVVPQGAWPFGIFLLIYLLVAGYASAFKIYDRVTLTPSQVAAMEWVRENTGPEAAFLILSGNQPLLDPASDWFPALTERVSVATVFGYEWIRDGDFARRISQYENLQNCRNQAEACLDAWREESDKDFTHVFIQSSSELVPLTANLEKSPNYELIYRDDDVSIFELSEN